MVAVLPDIHVFGIYIYVVNGFFKLSNLFNVVWCNSAFSTLYKNFDYQGPVSRKILSLEMDLSLLITMVTIVFSMLKMTRGLKIF